MRLALATPLALVVAGCALDSPPAASTPAPVDQAIYHAVGTEPGWSLAIDPRRMRYTGDYGETHVTVRTPESRPSFNGHRYLTHRLTVDITHAPCSDGMSDRRYPDTVTVTADGKTVHGCGWSAERGRHVSLAGTSWTITSVDGRRTTAQRKAEVRFTDDRIEGNAGCNSFGGSYTLKGDRLTVGRVISTKMACIGPGMKQERAVFAILAQPMTVSWRNDGAVTLNSEAGSMALTPSD